MTQIKYPAIPAPTADVQSLWATVMAQKQVLEILLGSVGKTNDNAAATWSALSSSATVDTTNASNISSGTLSNARLTAGQFPGTTTNDNAAAGNIGEYVSSSVVSGSAVSLSNNTAKDVTSISLTAGDWDVCGCAGFVGGTTTTVDGLQAWVSTASATFPGSSSADNGFGFLFANNATIFNSWGAIFVPLARKRFSLAATTTIYFSALSIFATSTCTAFGFVSARRVR